MKRFSNVISLGHFCSPAAEFERIGCRKCSFPFDWLITPSIENVISLIENGFEDFLTADYFYQLKQYPGYYRNVKLNIDFYHDFSPLKSFDSQIADVTQKYTRRINRFYQEIQNPTLFCRYITKSDYHYIMENHNNILAVLKKYNRENEIIYVANDDIGEPLESVEICYVKKDDGDSVCRLFLEKLPSVKTYILDNVNPATSKKRHSFVLSTIISKIIKRVCLRLNLVYRHTKQLDLND